MENFDHTKQIAHRPHEVVQMFPDCTAEPMWNTFAALRSAPYYALRLLAGASVIKHPSGIDGYYKMCSFGEDFILPEANFQKIDLLYVDFLRAFIEPRGYRVESFVHLIQHDYNLMLEAVSFMSDRLKDLLAVPEDVPRIYWVIPDEWACGYFRARLPIEYLKKKNILIDGFTYTSLNDMSHYDVFVVHRIPAVYTATIIQKLMLEHKLMVYDNDDNFQKIPTWSIVRQKFSPSSRKRGQTMLDIATVCTASTEDLAVVMGAREKTTVLPNLIKLKDYKQPEDRLTVSVSKNRMTGFHVATDDKSGDVRIIKHKTGAVLNTRDFVFEDEYRPVNIVWYGSNTHDGDLLQIVRPVLDIMDKYGLGVRFKFFGYCPYEFIDATLEAGASKPGITIKDEYKWAMEYIPAVDFVHFHDVLSSMETHIGLCPLVEHEFNASKSNLKILEFGAVGAPCVVTDFGEYADRKAISDDEVIRVAEGDHGGWLNAIDKLVSDDQLRYKMGTALMQNVRANWSWDNDNANRRKWDAFYTDLAERALVNRNQCFKDRQFIIEKEADGAEGI